MENDSGKISFLSFKCKFSEETDVIHDRIVEEFVRIHGNEVHCCCPSDRSTFAQSFQLPFSESTIKKLTVGPSYIGIILQNGKACRVKYTPNLIRSDHQTRSSSQKPDISFQVESDEAFARSLDERLNNNRSSGYPERLTRGRDFYLNSRSALFSGTHTHARSRGSRRYEPYSLSRSSIRPLSLGQIVSSNVYIPPHISNEPMLYNQPMGGAGFPSIRPLGPDSSSGIMDRINQGFFPLSGILQVSIEQSNFPTEGIAERVTLPQQESRNMNNSDENNQGISNSTTVIGNDDGLARESVINGNDENNDTPLLHTTTVLNREAFMPIAEEPIALETTNFGLPTGIIPLSTALETESQNIDGPSMIQVVENIEITDDDNDSNSLLSEVVRERNYFPFAADITSHSRDTPEEDFTFQRVETPTLLMNINEETLSQSAREVERLVREHQNNTNTTVPAAGRDHILPSQSVISLNHNIIPDRTSSNLTTAISRFQQVTSNLRSLFPMLSTVENNLSTLDNVAMPSNTVTSNLEARQNLVSSVATTMPNTNVNLQNVPSFTSVVEQQTSLDQLPAGFRPMAQRLGFMKTGKGSVTENTSKNDTEKVRESPDIISDRWWPSTGEVEWLEIDSGVTFSDISALHSEFLLVTKQDGQLWSWPYKQDNSSSVLVPCAHPHPLSWDLDLESENISLLSTSLIRASVVTQSGKIATFYDRVLRECSDKDSPDLVSQLFHPATQFPQLKNEDIIDVKCNMFYSAILTNSGKAFWWGLPPQHEIAGLPSHQDQLPKATEGQAFQIGDFVCLKKERNEIGALVINVNFLSGPQIGTIMRVLDEDSREASSGRRRYVVKLHELNSPFEAECHKEQSSEVKSGSINDVGLSHSMNLNENQEPTLATPLGLFARRRPRQPDIVLSCNEQIWSSDEFVFLGESSSVIGKVVTLDGQFAIVKSMDQVIEPNNEGLKVHFIKSLEKVIDIPTMNQGPSKRNVIGNTRYEKVLLVSPKCLVDPLCESSKYKGHKAVALATGSNGITLLLNRVSDSKSFIVLPENVKENNSKLFTSTKTITGVKDNMVSEGCVTVESEAVPAEQCNLEVKEIVPRSTNSIPTTSKIGSKRNADCLSDDDEDCSSGSFQSSNFKIDRLTKPLLFTFEKPNCTILFDRVGCPFPIKFGTCLQQSSMLECGPFNVVEFTQTGYGCAKDEKIINAVLVSRELHIIPSIIEGNKQKFSSTLESIERCVSSKSGKQKPTLKKLKIYALGRKMDSSSGFVPVSKSGLGTTSNSTNSNTDSMEEQSKIIKGNLEWLEERCSGNQNVLHVCASNISARKNSGSVRPTLVEMFHDEVFMLFKLLTSEPLRPYMKKMLKQRDCLGCTPFMTALLTKNIHAAFYILKGVASWDAGGIDQPFFDKAILIPTFSGITPAHQLVINSSRKQFGLSFGNALRVSNVPSGYSPRLLLKLFKTRYPSAYRAFIPVPKARWKLKNVRDKLRDMMSAADPTSKPSVSSQSRAQSARNGSLLQVPAAQYPGTLGRMNRAEALRATAKEGLVMFGDIDEMYQALAEMNGHNVLCETDHPAGALMSVVQHVLKVQIADEQPSDITITGSSNIRPPVSQQNSRSFPYVPTVRSTTFPSSGSRTGPFPTSRNAFQPVQSTPSAAVFSAVKDARSPYSKNREDTITKCFDDIITSTVLSRLLQTCSSVPSLTNSQHETALAFFLKNFNRLYPSHIHKLFLTWRPCGVDTCSFLKYCKDLPITASGEFEDTSTFVSLAEKEGRNVNEVKLGNSSKDSEENSSKLFESQTTSASNSTTSSSASKFPKSSGDLQGIFQSRKIEMTPSPKLEQKDERKAKANIDQNWINMDRNETVINQNYARMPSVDNSELEGKSSKINSPSLLKPDTRVDYSLSSSRNIHGLSPSPSLLATKVLEDIDLTQFEHEDKCVESENETQSTIDLTRPSHDVFSSPRFDWPEPNPLSYAAVAARLSDRYAVEATISRVENTHRLEPDVAEDSVEAGEISKNNLPKDINEEKIAEQKLYTSRLDEFRTATEAVSSASSEADLNDSSKKGGEQIKQCACEKRNSKLPLRLFDRFQATVFQLAKSWPSIHGTILGLNTRNDLQDNTPLSSEKLDSFTEILLSNPFDIIFELFLKTIQSQLQTGMSVPGSWEYFTRDISPVSSHFESEKELSIPVAKRFLGSVIRQLSIRLSKNANFDVSLRYKIGRHAKQSSEKKEDRLRDSIRLSLRAFSWFSVIGLLRAAESVISPVRNGVSKAQPRGMMSGLPGSGQMTSIRNQTPMFRPNIRIHGTPPGGRNTPQPLVLRTATRSDDSRHQPVSLSPLRLTSNPTRIQSSKNPKTTHPPAPYERHMSGDTDDSDEDEPFTMEIETPGSGTRLAGSVIDRLDDPMDLSADSDSEDTNWGVNSIGLNSPLAWAVDGHIRVSDELSGRMASGILRNLQDQVSSTPSIHSGNCYLARMFCRLVKEAVDLAKELNEEKEGKMSAKTRPFTVKPIQLDDSVEEALMEHARSLLNDTWSWMSDIMNSVEAQLKKGQTFDTRHYVNRLQTPDSDLDTGGFGRPPTLSYTYGSQPEEYLLYLMKAQSGEASCSLPVLDLFSYSHLSFVLDAYMYTLKHWPNQLHTSASNTGDSSQSKKEENDVIDPVKKQSVEENQRFFGEYLMNCSPGNLLSHAKQVLRSAKYPHIWLGKAFKSSKNGEKISDLESQDAENVDKDSASSSDKVKHESGNQRSEENTSIFVTKAHSEWKLSIAAFSKLFLTEAPGYERDSFLAAQAGGVGRMSRFQRSIAALRKVPMESRGSGGSNNVVTMSVNVRRSHLLMDGLKVFMDQMEHHPFGSLRVRFDGEEGAGPGVNRGLFAGFANALKGGEKLLDWPMAFFSQPGKLPEQAGMYAPISGIHHCQEAPTDTITFTESKSMTKLRRNTVFEGIGRFFGLTLWFNQTVPLILTRPVLKYLLEKEDQITWDDLAYHNASLYESLSHMISDAKSTAMTSEQFEDIYCCRFEAMIDGRIQDLMPNGSKIAVTPENVLCYGRLYAKKLLIENIENELSGLRKGLQQMVPKELLTSLTPEDLQLLLSGGVEDVDFSRLKSIITFSNTRGCSRDTLDMYRKWFWKIVGNMTPLQRQQLLYFATGSSLLPALDNKVGNSEELAITIDIINSNSTALPMASTCGQRISIPLYPSKKMLKKKLLQAIECQSYGLG